MKSQQAPRSGLAITRTLEDGPDYQPDWRHQVVQEYLVEIEGSADPSAALEGILTAELDESVRQLLLFHKRGPDAESPSIDYAVRCAVTNPQNRIASMIKAMVVAGRSVEQIAAELGTTPSNIAAFEKLYFDARRYLEFRPWLKSICFHGAGENATSEADRECRWLSVAFLRGWSGVREVVLTQVPKDAERGLLHAVRVASGRAHDYVVGLDASGTTPNEKDLQSLFAFSRMLKVGSLPLLEDPVEEETPPLSESQKRLKKLSFGEREKVRLSLEELDGLLQKKVGEFAAAQLAAAESEETQIEPKAP